MKIHENPKEILGNPVENDGKSTFLDGNAVFFALFELRQEAFRACGASKTPCEAKQKVVMEAPPAPAEAPKSFGCLGTGGNHWKSMEINRKLGKSMEISAFSWLQNLLRSCFASSLEAEPAKELDAVELGVGDTGAAPSGAASQSSQPWGASWPLRGGVEVGRPCGAASTGDPAAGAAAAIGCGQLARAPREGQRVGMEIG